MLATLDGLMQQLAEITDQLSRQTDMIKDGDHVALIRHFHKISQAYDCLNEGKKCLNDLYDRCSRDYVPDAMRRAGVKTVNVVGIGRVTVSYRYSCSMIDKEIAMDWLEKNGHGDMIQKTVNSSTLAAFSKNMLETTGHELPSKIFKVGTSPYTSITKV